ncbi:MAG: leucyl aminopeptidase [Ectothiorhodospiraceae bacterium]|nr:leucyl aminopeptidase [Ectothiorhodospiraceae bacterium]
MVKCTGHYGTPEKIEADVHAFMLFENDAVFNKSVKLQCDEYAAPILEVYEDGTFAGKEGEVFSALIDGKRIMLIGLGPLESLELEKIRKASAKASKEARKNRIDKLALYAIPEFVHKKIPFLTFEEIAMAMVEGCQLALYNFDRYKSKSDDDKAKEIKEVQIVASDEGYQDRLKGSINETMTIIEGVEIARDLSNTPAADLTAEDLAKYASDMATKLKVKSTILKKKEIQQHKMAGLLAVNKGSENEPRFIVLEYNTTKRKLPLFVLVGKGVTFDSGGLSIKPAKGMEEMKMDMAGAATVLGAFYTAVKLKLPIRLAALIPATDNMTGGGATCPGDVIQYSNGTSVEVLNTDAEGRLILADALIYAQRYKATGVIDVATLTGACVVALGSHATGMMGNNDELLESLEEAGIRTYERVWELPLFDEYDKMIKGTITDIKNIGPRWAGAITAGAFLKNFVGELPWVHLDVAGTAMYEEAMEYHPKGGTGIGVRLLTEFFNVMLEEDEE